MGKLSIQDIAKVLVTKNNLKQSEANHFATEMFAIIQERLEKNDQIKVKGLGTWKVITVDARESISVQTGDRVMIEEHAKITFTPDATMKELVNKPFSQFETVVLNDNVEFDDMKEQPADSNIEAESSVEEVAVPQAEVEEAPQVEAEAPQAEVKEESQVETVAPLLEVEGTQVEVEEPLIEVAGSSDEVAEPEETSSMGLRWLWIVLGLIAVAAISAVAGYYYGSRHASPAILTDTVVVRDTVYISESQDTTTTEVEVTTTTEVEVPKKEPVQQTEDEYAAKDERIRLGAYRIVGLDHEVTVLAGQTFYSICRAHLGPDMECYIEVYNDLPRNPQIKAGQVIKIPKLQLKKRKKQ